LPEKYDECKLLLNSLNDVNDIKILLESYVQTNQCLDNKLTKKLPKIILKYYKKHIIDLNNAVFDRFLITQLFEKNKDEYIHAIINTEKDHGYKLISSLFDTLKLITDVDRISDMYN